MSNKYCINCDADIESSSDSDFCNDTCYNQFMGSVNQERLEISKAQPDNIAPKTIAELERQLGRAAKPAPSNPGILPSASVIIDNSKITNSDENKGEAAITDEAREAITKLFNFNRE